MLDCDPLATVNECGYVGRREITDGFVQNIDAVLSLLALLGRADLPSKCPLLGEKQSWTHMAEFDPFATWRRFAQGHVM